MVISVVNLVILPWDSLEINSVLELVVATYYPVFSIGCGHTCLNPVQFIKIDCGQQNHLH